MKNVLKTVAVALCTALTLGLVGCQPDNEDLIIGSWQVEKQVYTMSDGTHSQTETETMEPGETGVITFNKDLSFVATTTWVEDGETTSVSDRGTYSISGDLLTMVSTYSWENEDGEWQSDVETMTFTIKSLDKKEMVLSMSETETEDGVTYTYTMEATFKKI